MPKYAIYAQAHREYSRILHGKSVKGLNRYHLVEVDRVSTGDLYSICGKVVVDREYLSPLLRRWDTLKEVRCDECEAKAGDAARRQVESEQAERDRKRSDFKD